VTPTIFQDRIAAPVHALVIRFRVFFEEVIVDDRTGNILSPELMELLQRGNVETAEGRLQREYEHLREMAIPPTPEQQRRGRVGRNDPCPCGSGKKFKRCCFRPVSAG
jgi:uncharacterized protein YecA (UPF0149 family)